MTSTIPVYIQKGEADLLDKIQSYYSSFELKTNPDDILRFSEICQGAEGTLKFLKNHMYINLAVEYTDALFFLRALQSYKEEAKKAGLNPDKILEELSPVCDKAISLRNAIEGILKKVEDKPFYRNAKDKTFAMRHQKVVCTLATDNMSEKILGISLIIGGAITMFFGITRIIK